MRTLLMRFAKIVMAKLTSLVTEYAPVRRDEATETWTETAASRALASALTLVLRWLDNFPWLHTARATWLHDEFERIVVHLRAPIHLNGAQPT